MLALGALVAIGVTVVFLALVPQSETNNAPSAASERAPVAPPPTGPVAKPLVRVLLQSNPPGATVVDDKGAPWAVTPAEVMVPFGGYHSIDFVLDGYRRAHYAFRAEVDTTVAQVLERNQNETPPRPPDRMVRRHRRSVPKGKASGAAPDLDSGARTINPFER